MRSDALRLKLSRAFNVHNQVSYKIPYCGPLAVCVLILLCTYLFEYAFISGDTDRFYLTVSVCIQAEMGTLESHLVSLFAF